MRIYRGSDADIVLRPFMVRLSEIVSFDLQLWTSGAYVIKRSTTESGMTIDKINNIVNVHLTDKETSYLDAGVLNAKMMYRITDSEYPDGTYDGIITIPQEYYMMTPPDYSGGTAGDIYESGYTEGYNTAIQNSVLSINGEKGDLNLKTINGNGLLGEGDIKIEGGGSGSTSDFSYFYIDAADFILPTRDVFSISIPTSNVHYYGDAPYRYGYINIKDKKYKKNTTIPLNFGTDGNTTSKFMYDTDTYELDFIDEGIKIYANKSLDPTTPICTFFARTIDDINNSITVDNLPTVVGGTYITFGSGTFNVDAAHYNFAKMRFGEGKNQYLVDANIVGHIFNDGTSDVTIRFCCEKGYYEATWLRQVDRIKFTCLQIWNKVNSVNGKKGDVVIDIPKKTSQLTNDSEFQTKADVDAAIKSGSVQSSEISNIKVLSRLEYDDLTEKDPNTLYYIKN